MKNIICLIVHPKRLTPISFCKADDFENDDENIRVYRCKYCGDFVAGYTRCINARIEKPHFDTIKY